MKDKFRSKMEICTSVDRIALNLVSVPEYVVNVGKLVGLTFGEAISNFLYFVAFDSFIFERIEVQLN